MNKIYSDPIDKAKMLIDGLKQNRSFLASKGYDLSVIERLEKDIEEMTVEGEAVAIEEEALSKHRIQCHIILDRLRNNLSSGKASIKRMFDQEQWNKYGVSDKR